MNILITGAAGFIGSTTAEQLIKEGHQVIGIDNFDPYYDRKIKENNIKELQKSSLFSLYELDILDYEKFEKVFKENKIDYVLHLAAKAGVRPSIEDPIGYQNVNNLGTNNLLELCRKYGVKKLVLASSSSVYGNNKVVPFKETDVVDYAISPYAASKKANEVLAHVYHSLFDMDIILLRFFTVYGPRQRPDLAINKFVRLIQNNEPIPLYGDGTTSRDYTYIDDIVSGILLSFKYLKEHQNVYEIINLGSNNPVSLIEMVRTIEKTLNKIAIINWLPMQPGDVDITYADISKARKLLGYNPSITFENGIKNFVAWHNKLLNY